MNRTERNRMDRVIGAKVRSKDRCERCGKTSNLQAAHIFSRRYSKLRHYEPNILCLCSGCHFWAHQNPILFAEFCRVHLGSTIYQDLIDKRNDLTK